MNQLSTSRLAQVFIVLISLGGIAMAGCAARGAHVWHYSQFLLLLLIAVLSARFKVKLPGLSGNMSVNLPFIPIASAELDLAEALLVASASTFAQCFPKRGGRPKGLQMLFNVCAMTIAAGLTSLVLSYGLRLTWTMASSPALLAPAAAVFFLANTLPVATVIALSEGLKILKTWSSIFHLSFPYYVASAGISAIVTAASHYVGWLVPLLVLPVTYAIYRSYQLYFGRMAPMPDAPSVTGAI